MHAQGGFAHSALLVNDRNDCHVSLPLLEVATRLGDPGEAVMPYCRQTGLP
jgi:hypothetical protein